MASDTASAENISGVHGRRLPDFFRWLTAGAAVISVFVLGWMFWGSSKKRNPLWKNSDSAL